MKTRLLILTVMVLLTAMAAAPVPIRAAVEVTLVPPNGREQLPLIYVHGFNDDGASWGTTTGPYWNELRDITPGAGDPDSTPVENYAVQYWAPGGNPFANGDLGWAVLRTADTMALPAPQEVEPGEDSNPYNSPDPVSYFLDNVYLMGLWLPVCEVYFPFPAGCVIPAAEFLEELSERRIQNNYNRNGEAKYHAEDLKDLLRSEFSGGLFEDDIQLNIITHSAGGIDVRALLGLLNDSESRTEQERVANVMFTAPPFGGSTIAEIANLIYDDLDADVFFNPWFATVIENQVEPPLKVFLQSMIQLQTANTLPEDDVAEMIDTFANAASLLGHDLLVRGPELNTALVERQALVGAIKFVTPVVSDLFGIPGTPKVNVDLRPSGAVSNLREWQQNPHTKQFVTWGEGGIGYNLSPDIADIADGNYGTIDDINNTGYLKAFPGDLALTKVSARSLTTDAPGGWMVPLKGYPTLTHGGLIVATPITGAKWVEALMTPVTTLRLSGPVEAANWSDRYYLVSPEFTFDFLPESRTFRDQFNDEITVQPPTGPNTGGVQYRVISYPAGSAVFGEWQDLDVTESGDGFESEQVSFADLESDYGLSGETLFYLQWRSINELGGREGIRTALFRIDGDAPTVMTIRVFDSADENNTSEIYGRSLNKSRFRAVRGEVALAKKDSIAYQILIPQQIESQWVVRQSNRIKVLMIEFDGVGTIKYAWDDSKKLATNPQVLVNRDFLGQVLNVLDPGPHTLYFHSEDFAGNRTDTQTVSVLIDAQPPVTALNYQSTHPLGIVVGPNTPLQFHAQDAELGGATGFLTVPGHPNNGVDVGSVFTLGETDLAETASAQGLLGAFVTLSAEASDRVGNTVTNSYEVLYDWTAPNLKIISVGGSISLADGTYRTTQRTIDIRLTGGEGLPVQWTSAEQGGSIAGGEATLVTGLRGVYSAEVRLMDGLNVISFRTEDPVGNQAVAAVVIERSDELVEGVSARPIELLVRGVDNAAFSDDGSTVLFSSGKDDLVSDDTNGVDDIFTWRNGATVRLNTNIAGDQAVGGDSRNPGISGDGRYAYFASSATNLVDEPVSGVNLYVKDLNSGEIAIISRDLSGNPVNMSVVFGRLSFIQTCSTYNGRYVFFEDKFSGYVAGDTNGNMDIFIADLDPDGDGDLFEGGYVISRVSLAAGGVQGTGGGFSNGSRRPSCTADGLLFAFETAHTNLIPGDTNNQVDVVIARLAGIDAGGTLDLSSVSLLALDVHDSSTAKQGQLPANGARAAKIGRGGKVVTFTTSGNLNSSDTNQLGPNNDVYLSIGTSSWQNRILIYHEGKSTGLASGDPSVSEYGTFGTRLAFFGKKRGLADPDRANSSNDVNDLFSWTSDRGWQRDNWLSEQVPTTQAVTDGGITADGRWLWWVTGESYPGIEDTVGGRALYKRRVDDDDTGVLVTITGAPITTEAGAAATLNVSLKTRPTADEVIVRVEVTDPSEGVATTENLTFTSLNWDDSQFVFVSGLDDADSDGDVEYAVRFTPTSFDSQYNGVGGVEISLTNRDDDPPPAAPAIRTQPRSLTITAGDSARFSVVASGVPAPTFQWTFDGQPIQGQTSDILNLRDVQVEQAGRYSVEVSNSAGELASAAAALTVDLPVAAEADLSLDYDPAPVSASAGQELRYSLVIGNKGPDKATSTTVTAGVPGSAVFVSAKPNQGTCSESGGTVTCLLGDLNAGRSANITIVTVPGSEGKVAQSASVFSAEADPDGSNNLVTATTAVSAKDAIVAATPIPTGVPQATPFPTEEVRIVPTATPAGAPTPAPTATPIVRATVAAPATPSPREPATGTPRQAEPTPVIVAAATPEATPAPGEALRETPTPLAALPPTIAPAATAQAATEGAPGVTPEPGAPSPGPAATAVPVEQPVTGEPPREQPATSAPAPTTAPTTPPAASPGCGAAVGEGPFPADVGILLMLLPALGFLLRRRNRNARLGDDDREADRETAAQDLTVPERLNR